MNATAHPASTLGLTTNEALALGAFTLVTAGGIYWYTRPPPTLAEKLQAQADDDLTVLRKDVKAEEAKLNALGQPEVHGLAGGDNPIRIGRLEDGQLVVGRESGSATRVGFLPFVWIGEAIGKWNKKRARQAKLNKAMAAA